jgi:hypothetical protein
LYDLSTLGDVTVGDEENKVLIVKTLLKLPKAVRRKVLDEVTFIIMGEAWGTVTEVNLTPLVIRKLIEAGKLNPNNRNSSIRYSALLKTKMSLPLIFLNFAAMKKESESDGMDTMAHEIAHFILGHGSISSNPEAEKETDDLAEKWGFNRSYRD